MFLAPGDAAAIATSRSSISSLGEAHSPLLAIDLRGATRASIGVEAHDRLVDTLPDTPWVNVALIDHNLDRTVAALADAADIVLRASEGDRPSTAEAKTPGSATTLIDVDDPIAELAALESAIAESAQAAVALVQLLRLTQAASVPQALHAESLTYATLQSSERFQRWLADRESVAPQPDRRPVVATERDGGLLRITLDRPDRRNALNVAMRDQLAEALELLDADRSLDGALLTGAGLNFSAGGDLDEFGTTPSPAIGHHVRTVRSLPRLVHQVRDRLRVHVHGTCVGAGIELPAFANSVLADPETTFRLPEVGFGLVPGAGGTVSVSRRCGRHRTSWWAIRGVPIDARTAISWGLIDRIAPRPSEP